MTAWLSDDTWNSLDPSAARLNRSGRRALIGGLVGVTALLAGVAVCYASGVLVPRLSVHDYFGQTKPGTHSYDVVTKVRNDGWFAERIVSITTTKPGMRVRVDSVRPLSVPAGGSARLVVHVTITDCDEATGTDSSSDAVALRVDRPWGTASTSSRRSNETDATILDEGLLQSACGQH